MSDVEAFLNELETIDNDRKAERAASRGPRTVYDVIKPEMGKVYQAKLKLNDFVEKYGL